jgi:flagellar protein FliS
MWNSGHDAYLESRVLAADPVELVSLLYQACTQAVREARRHLAAGQIAERSREINKACAIVIELATSLDHERGGEISQRLALLYDYMERRLLQANMQQSDAPLADVLGLLTTLSEAWAGVRQPEEKSAAESSKSQPAADSRWTPSATESPTLQPATQNAWSQPAADSRWSPSATESAASQSVPESTWTQPAADSRWTPSATESPNSQPPAQNAWSQPAPDSRWTPSATESPNSQPPAQNAWSQPALDSRWTPTATESAASQSVPESTWSQPATQNAWSPPAAENPPSQPAAENAWSQPTPEVDDYRLRAFSF